MSCDKSCANYLNMILLIVHKLHDPFWIVKNPYLKRRIHICNCVLMNLDCFTWIYGVVFQGWMGSKLIQIAGIWGPD